MIIDNHLWSSIVIYKLGIFQPCLMTPEAQCGTSSSAEAWTICSLTLASTKALLILASRAHGATARTALRYSELWKQHVNSVLILEFQKNVAWTYVDQWNLFRTLWSQRPGPRAAVSAAKMDSKACVLRLAMCHTWKYRGNIMEISDV